MFLFISMFALFSVYVWVCVFPCMCLCVYFSMRVFGCVCICMYLWVCICVFWGMCVFVYVFVFWVFLCVYMHMCACVHICVCMHVHVYMCTYVCACVWVCVERKYQCSQSLNHVQTCQFHVCICLCVCGAILHAQNPTHPHHLKTVILVLSCCVFYGNVMLHLSVFKRSSFADILWSRFHFGFVSQE